MIREIFCLNCKGYVYTVAQKVPTTNPLCTILRFNCPNCRSGLDLTTKVKSNGLLPKPSTTQKRT